MVRRIFSSIRQYETHRQLIRRVRGAAARGKADLDAIIVPASRRASNLDHAVTLVRAARCELVVFCSRDALVADVARLLADRCFGQAVVVDLPDDFQHRLLRFASSDLSRSQMPGLSVSPNGDLSTKRNLGLLLARMLGWSRILFMDDDVRDVALADLQATVSQLGRYRSVGMRVTDFPDNSVVCHAHRETGGTQDIFVSGSVLAVNPLEEVGFFPEIYNEDWFFFFDDILTGRLAWSGRDVTQLQYDPFGHTQRAERQEFGDLLAEGLYALLHQGGGLADAGCDYWDTFIVARRRFMQNIIRRSTIAAPEIRAGLLDAVHTAMGCLRQIESKACAYYVQAWREDLQAWREDLVSRPRVPTVDAALTELGLRRSGAWEPKPSPSSVNKRPVRNAVAGPVLIPSVATVGLLLGRGTPALTRGRRPRGQLPVPAGLPGNGAAGQPNSLEPGASHDIPWTDTTAETQPMHKVSPPSAVAQSHA